MARQRFATFGEYLQKLRETAGLKQEEVEQRSGGAISREYLSLLERGQRKAPSGQMCQVIARVYGRPWKEVWGNVQSEMLREPVTAEIRSPESTRELVAVYGELNEKGQEYLLEQARLLRQNSKYQK